MDYVKGISSVSFEDIRKKAELDTQESIYFTYLKESESENIIYRLMCLEAEYHRKLKVISDFEYYLGKSSPENMNSIHYKSCKTNLKTGLYIVSEIIDEMLDCNNSEIRNDIYDLLHEEIESKEALINVCFDEYTNMVKSVAETFAVESSSVGDYDDVDAMYEDCETVV